jgi:hypothetical protein
MMITRLALAKANGIVALSYISILLSKELEP